MANQNKAKSSPNLPAIVYVYQERDGKDTYLIGGETMEDVAEKGKRIQVGIYRLESLVMVSLEVRVEKQ